MITVSAEKGAQDQRDGGGGEQEEASLQPPAREADQHCPDRGEAASRGLSIFK